ncbi:unannotated protein [freshwater metagenome]|uniref:Unannotated protein n=1 Tax=freshwater metagenome TaxID=449393 RepID=A0A6J7J9Q9_9ZZZZ
MVVAGGVVVVAPGAVVVVGGSDPAITPGEPVSVEPTVGVAAANAPFTPTALSVEIAPDAAAALSKLFNVGAAVEAPKLTFEIKLPEAS